MIRWNSGCWFVSGNNCHQDSERKKLTQDTQVSSKSCIVLVSHTGDNFVGNSRGEDGDADYNMAATSIFELEQWNTRKLNFPRFKPDKGVIHYAWEIFLINLPSSLWLDDRDLFAAGYFSLEISAAPILRSSGLPTFTGHRVMRSRCTQLGDKGRLLHSSNSQNGGVGICLLQVDSPEPLETQLSTAHPLFTRLDRRRVLF